MSAGTAPLTPPATGPDTSGRTLRRPSLPPGWPNAEASRLVRAAGIEWHTQRMGSGPPLLLIHGTAASVHSWRDLMPALARQFDVLAMDLPGHGFTAMPGDEDMSLAAITDAIAGLMATSEFSPRCIVGHSAGAAIAVNLALERRLSPDAIVGLNAALLPFGGLARRLFSPMAKLFSRTRLMPGMVARRAQDLRAVRRLLASTGSEIDARGLGCYQWLLCRESHVAAVLAMMAQWDLGALSERLPSLDVRLRLVAGAEDRAVRPGEADKVAAVVPGATVTRLEHCGHLAHEEHPDLVSALVAELCCDASDATGAGS